MKALGVVVEYNPLHHGHIYHLEKAKELAEADIVIAAMSGNVVQRGEFSLTDKFAKTHWALAAGIDLVVEIPGVLVLQNADRFALSAVDILDSLGAEEIVFGSESGDIERLRFIAELLRTDAYSAALKVHLENGESFPSSAENALKELTGTSLALSPNDMLGIQYLQAIHHLESDMRARVVRRIAAGYHDEFDEKKDIQSASAIRKRLLEGGAYAESVPPYVRSSLEKQTPLHWEKAAHLLSYRLHLHTSSSLQEVFSFEEGLENLFLKNRDFRSFSDFLAGIATKRYTQSKIKRSAMHALLDVQKDDIDTFRTPYLRILGMSEKGRSHLGAIKKGLGIPLLTKIRRERHPYLDLDLRISRIYGLLAATDIYKQEFDPVICG